MVDLNFEVHVLVPALVRFYWHNVFSFWVDAAVSKLQLQPIVQSEKQKYFVLAHCIF